MMREVCVIASSDTNEAKGYGAVLLQVRQALFYSLILAAAGPLLVLLSVAVPASALSVGLRILTLLFGLSLTVVGIRKLRHRPVMMQLTDRGILIHAKVAGIRVSRSLLHDLFVPWKRVERMYYLTSTEVQSRGLWLISGGWGTADPVIVLRIRMDEFWPANGALRDDSLTRNARPDEIYLNAVESSPNKTQLWDQVQAIARRYGVPTPEHETRNSGAN